MTNLTKAVSSVNHSSPFLVRLTPDRRLEIERAAVIAFLIFECLNVTEDLARDLERHHRLSLSDIERFQIRSIPNDIANAIISHECLKRFGPSILQSSNLFYSFDRSTDVRTWRLDLNESLSRRGLLLSITHPRYGFFTDILVFRHCKDEKPFRLQVRADQREFAA